MASKTLSVFSMASLFQKRKSFKSSLLKKQDLSLMVIVNPAGMLTPIQFNDQF